MTKTMKYLSMAALAMVGIVMTGCSSDDSMTAEPQQPENKSNVVTLTTTVSMDGATTRAVTEGGVKTFKAGDRIAIIYKNGINETTRAVSNELTSLDLVDGGKGAKITVTLSYPRAGTVRFVYPASMTVETPTTSADVTADENINMSALATQDGSLSTIGDNYDLCYGDGTLTTSGDDYTLPSNVTLLNKLAIGKFTIKNSATSSDITSTVTTLYIKNGSDTYTVTPSSSLSAIWVAMKPISSGDIVINAAVGKDIFKKTVSGTTISSKPLVANTINPITVTVIKVEGALSGLFTVNSSGKQVYFSQGNLQYIGTKGNDDENNTGAWWCFATNQWDHITDQYREGKQVDRDLFGWGTSGYNHGATRYQPWSTGSGNTDYYAYGNSVYNLYDSDGTADWGYNAIMNGGNTENSGWRTPTRDEWEYMRFSRTTPSGILFAKASVNGKNGVIFLPDNWNTSYHSLSNTNVSSSSFSSNSINKSDWENDFEAHGAVFLPATGARYGTSVQSDGEVLCWSASKYWEYNSYSMNFSNTGYGDNCYRNWGLTVRLVRDAE